jgi:hypothetical protein
MRTAPRLLRLFVFAALVSVSPAAHADGSPAAVGSGTPDGASLAHAHWATSIDAVVPAHVRADAQHHRGASGAVGVGSRAALAATSSCAPHRATTRSTAASVAAGAAAPRAPPSRV